MLLKLCFYPVGKMISPIPRNAFAQMGIYILVSSFPPDGGFEYIVTNDIPQTFAVDLNLAVFG